MDHPQVDSECDNSETSGTDVDTEGSIVEPLEKEPEESLKRKFSNDDYVSRKKRKLDSVRPPTVEELNQLRETENLFNSSLFRMQIEEMLKEVQMKTKYLNLFNEWLNEFKSLVLGLECSRIYDLTDELCFKNSTIKPPIFMNPVSDKGKLKFICPENVTIGGSFSIQACLGPLYTIDLHIHLPKALFWKNDQLNLRFDRKRACYLAVLAEALIGSKLVEEANFVQANGCILKPLLELKPSGKLGQHVRVLLWPVTNPDWVPLPRLRPDRGNIKPEWFFGKIIIHQSNDPTCMPSPHYNSGIAQDVVWKQNQEMLEAELSAPPLQNGLILLKVWLRQRHLDKGYGGFGGFIMAMYLVFLLQNKRLNKMMSSYQVARITWNCLAQSDWTKKGISLSSASNSPPLGDFHKHFQVVFVDVSGYCNLCAHVREEVYQQVRTASAEAVALLDASTSNNFQSLFMMPVAFEQCYDHIIRLQNPCNLRNVVKEKCKFEECVAWTGWVLPQLLNLIVPVLRKGLGERVHSVSLQLPKLERWNCSEPPPSPSGISVPVLLGLRLNAAEAFQLIQKGPEADQPEAAEFRSFWGKLSQLRRFRDGRICEAIMWSNETSPCEQVVDFVLKNHLGLDGFLHISNLCIKIMKPLLKSGQKNNASSNKLSVEEASQVVIASFDSLSKMLRSLKDMTLSVNAVQGISPVFRYTDVVPPIALDTQQYLKTVNISKSRESSLLLSGTNSNPNFIPPYCAPIEAVMMLELSGKWPQNLEAVRRLKAAFCVQMAKALKNECSLTAQAHVDHVDVLKDNFVFRIWLAAQKEVSLMKQRVNEMGLVSYHDSPESLELEEKLVLLPKITGSLHGLHQQFPGFGPTVCLAKRWLSSQFLGPPYFSNLVTELLVAYLYLSPEPFCRAVESQLGFMHFLRLVSSTDWLTVPLIVNLNDEFSRERIAELETQFHSSRRTLPPLFIATPYDRTISQCTRVAPTLQMLIRLGTLATEALRQMQSQLLESEVPNIWPIFRPNLEEYDVIIKFYLPRHFRGVRKVILNDDSSKIPIVGYDPAQYYLSELREGYGFCALFFHDHYGGDVIGVVWKPSVTQVQDFKVNAVSGCKPTKKSKMILNIDAILEDFKIIGAGLVMSVENRTLRTGQEVS